MASRPVAWLLWVVIVVTVASDSIPTAHIENQDLTGLGQPPGFQLGSGAGEQLRDSGAQATMTTTDLVANVRASALNLPSDGGMDPRPP